MHLTTVMYVMSVCMCLKQQTDDLYVIIYIVVIDSGLLFVFWPSSLSCSKNSCLLKLKYTVGTESIQTPLNFSLFVILQPFAKII